jgi:phage gpG-like protein
MQIYKKMNDTQNFFLPILRDIQTELDDEFDRNFERKAFFDRAWKPTKFSNSRGSLLVRSGALRRGNRSYLNKNTIRFENTQAYAALHNEGGEITVTTKMKKFFWFMHFKAGGAVSKTVVGKDGKRHLFISSESKEKMQRQANSNSTRNKMLNEEAAMWKMLALKKVGSKIKMQKRQFIGHHPHVDRIIQEQFARGTKHIEDFLNNKFR